LLFDGAFDARTSGPESLDDSEESDELDELESLSSEEESELSGSLLSLLSDDESTENSFRGWFGDICSWSFSISSSSGFSRPDDSSSLGSKSSSSSSSSLSDLPKDDVALISS